MTSALNGHRYRRTNAELAEIRAAIYEIAQAEKPATVRGVEIPAGAFVMAILGSANTDPAYFGPDAGELRLRRENARQHVSFGAGPHHCLGASLARLEASIALDRMIGRFPGLALDGDVTWNGRITLRGPARLPVFVGRALAAPSPDCTALAARPNRPSVWPCLISYVISEIAARKYRTQYLNLQGSLGREDTQRMPEQQSEISL